MRYSAPRTQATCAELRMWYEFLHELTDEARSTAQEQIDALCDELYQRSMRDIMDLNEDIYPY